MFDIGFWEITVIAVVALLVVGPKEFPALVRTIGAWMGRMRSFVNEFREELDREVNRADELKRLAERESKIAELHEVIDEARQTIPVEPARRRPDAQGGSEGGDEKVKGGDGPGKDTGASQEAPGDGRDGRAS